MFVVVAAAADTVVVDVVVITEIRSSKSVPVSIQCREAQ